MTMIIDGTNGGFFPSWTTATRPASPAVGQMGYNTTTGQFDAYTSNGWVSVATSATAPVSGPAFSAYTAGTGATIGTSATKMTYDTEEFDTNNCFSSSRFTPTTAGYYQINAQLQPNSSYAGGYIGVFKNGTNYKYGNYTNSAGQPFGGFMVSTLVYCNGSTDYIEIYAALTTSQASSAGSFFSWVNGFLARAA